jgi:hypothetical protein
MSAIVRRRNTPKTAILARDTPQIIAEVAAMSFLVERYASGARTSTSRAADPSASSATCAPDGPIASQPRGDSCQFA